MFPGTDCMRVPSIVEHDIWLGLQRIRRLLPEERYRASELDKRCHCGLVIAHFTMLVDDLLHFYEVCRVPIWIDASFKEPCSRIVSTSAGY